MAREYLNKKQLQDYKDLCKDRIQGLMKITESIRQIRHTEKQISILLMLPMEEKANDRI